MFGKLSKHQQKREEIMSNLDIKFVAAACPELTASECEALLAMCRDITRSDDDIYPAMLRANSRSLFPDIRRDITVSPIPPANVNRFDFCRIQQAIEDLEAAQNMLRKVRKSSDTVGMAIRDIGIIADELQEVKQ
tara:strand:- start:546 stop:950 length:405 start_codon:yes stop_codon:yes gene_type:complete